MELTYRHAVEADFIPIQRLVQECFQRPVRREDVRNAGYDTYFPVAVHRSVVVGVGCLYLIRQLGRWTAHTGGIAINSEYRGQGIGKRLLSMEVETVQRYADRANETIRFYGMYNPTRKVSGPLFKSCGFRLVAAAVEHGQNLVALDLKPNPSIRKKHVQGRLG